MPSSFSRVIGLRPANDPKVLPLPKYAGYAKLRTPEEKEHFLRQIDAENEHWRKSITFPTNDPEQLRLLIQEVIAEMGDELKGDPGSPGAPGAPGTPGTGSAVHAGQVIIPFASFLTEDSIAVTGQADLVADSPILVSIFADNDDVLAQDWQSPIAHSIDVGNGFTITLRPKVGTFMGPVTVNWFWTP